MSEFKTIETQEQFDEMIKDRIIRAKEAARKELTEEYADKYSDYDSLKEQLEEKNNKINELGNQLTDYQTKESGVNNQLTELKNKLKQYENDSVKTRIAQEYGIDSQLANRITGDDEAAMREDAKRLKEIIGDTRWRKAPQKDNESASGSDKQIAIKNMLKNMKGEE